MLVDGSPWNRSISIEGSSDNPLFSYVQNRRHGPVIHKWVSNRLQGSMASARLAACLDTCLFAF